jgi:HEAT repeat protein
MRQTAIGLLGRLEGDAGIPALVEMSRAGDGRTARLATEALARSGDPRARRALRELAGETRATTDARAAALTGLGGEFGSAQDAELLMTFYPGLSNDRLRDAALAGVASIGTAAGRRWLLALVRDESAEGRVRRKAASLLERAGVPVRDVTAAYDGVSDGEVRVQLIELLARAGTRDALAKLVAIARADTQPAVRRRAIALLGRSEDAAVREALRDLVGQ